MDTGALQRVIADRARRQNTGSEEVKMEMARPYRLGASVRLTISARCPRSCARARPATSPDRMFVSTAGSCGACFDNRSCDGPIIRRKA